MSRTEHFRCQFHLTPPTGWMNDPNGICQYKGTYHVFFQYAPDYPADDNKSWGHYISSDCLHWSFVGTTFFPDCRYDRNGAFSGNALIEDDTMIIYYTGNVEQEGDHDYTHSGRESNTIRVTSKDGLHFSDKECVLSNPDYPSDYTCHIRDPKVWKEGQLYRMVLGGRKNDDSGAVLFYHSTDGIRWQLSHTATSKQPFGFMWECPDVFSIEEHTFLSFCPQGVAPEALRYQNYHLSGYLPLSQDALALREGDTGERVLIEEETFQEWDYGFDFYAPETFLDDKGRRILIGWVGGPDMSYDEPGLASEHWIHKLTVPRVITYRNGQLLQTPIPELTSLRGDTYSPAADGSYRVTCAAFDWELTRTASRNPVVITIGSDIELSYREEILSLTFRGATGGGRTTRKAHCAGLQNLRILADRSVLEIFVNDGAVVMTSHFFPEEGGLTLTANGDFTAQTVWDMDTCVISRHP